MMRTEIEEEFRGLVIPGGLVHAHIHLDKCYLLEKTPIGDGSFQEALESTSKSKASFTNDDLIERGSRLITASLEHGVLLMRAFVEVDPTVDLKCLQAGLELQRRFQRHCTIQLVIFAQDPLLYPNDASKQTKMADLMEQACEMTGEDTVLGSTPYVDGDYNGQCENIKKLFDLASKYNRNVDFHLDYNLDEMTKPLIWFVLEEAHERNWKKLITIGHATRLSLFDEMDWKQLKDQCVGLKVSFVALPPSDLYMQGRQTVYKSRSRATIPLFELYERGIPCALAVNNVANLFTPQGDGDPLALLPLMVGLWQSAKPDHLQALLSMVSVSAVKVIMGEEESSRLVEPQTGVMTVSRGGIVASLDIDVNGADYTILLKCKNIQEAVLSPSPARLTVKGGRVVAWKKVETGIESFV